MTRLVSRVYDMGPSPAPIGTEAERRNADARATAWRRHGLVVLDPEDIEDCWLRQAVVNRANALYGRRGTHGQR